MKKGTMSILTGLLLIAAALCFAGYNLWDSHRAGMAANAVLSRLQPQIEQDAAAGSGVTKYAPIVIDNVVVDEVVYPDYVLHPEMEMPTQEIDGVDYIGTIDLPTLGLCFPVVSDWDYAKLQVSPCRYSGSAYFDDMVICAHNYRDHFSTLKNLRLDDELTFTDVDGNVFRYRVLEIETLQPQEVDRMRTGDWDLTLFTCTVGGRSRVTVRCERMDKNMKS